MAEEATSDVKEEVGQVTTEVESSPTETAEPVAESNEDSELSEQETVDKEIAKDMEAEDDSEAPEEDSEDKADESQDEPAEEEPAEPKKGAEARKEQLQSEIRDLVSKRNELRQEITNINAQVYQPASAEQLVDQGYDPAMARVEALEQRTQMAEFNAYVSDLNASLNTEALRVMSDFPVFDPESPQFDKSLSERAEAVYRQAAQIQIDPNTGLTVQANALPYDIYKAFAETAQSGSQTGAVQGQRAAEKNLAAADTVSSAAPKAPKEDLFLKGLLGEA